MYINSVVDFSRRKLLLLTLNGLIDEVDLVPPYFYVIARLNELRYVNILAQNEGVYLEETDYKAIIYDGTRYRVDNRFKVIKVVTSSPLEVPRVSLEAQQLGLRVSAMNVRYHVRNTFDRNIKFFNIIPLYYGFDCEAIDKIRKLRILTLDVEVIDDRPVVCSTLSMNLLDEVSKENVKTYRLPSEADELRKEIQKHYAIVGHNLIGYDIKYLKKIGIDIDPTRRVLIDNAVILSTHGYSLQVGASKSLYAVSRVLSEEAGITDEELKIKEEGIGRVTRMPFEDLCKYNRNDVVITAKLTNVILPFCLVVSGITQVPLTEAISLRAGMISEYALLRFCELQGFIPEYRKIGCKLTASRVYAIGTGVTFQKALHLDVKMMYPHFVLSKKVDPMLHLGNKEFDTKQGYGFLYSLVKRLKAYREESKRLKKINKQYSALDKGIKALLNALAYGVQAKSSGLAIFGNPYCPEVIFYGTRDVQFKAIDFLNKEGYKVLYSDTDSFIVELGDRDPKECMDKLNQYLKQYGLEVDLEDIYDYFYIYSKKNYIAVKSGKLIIKGSALKNLDKYYLPDALRLEKLLLLPKEERLKYIKEVITSASIEELFTTVAQQFWRLIGKSIESVKRASREGSRWLRVLTVWEDPRVLYLKKVRPSHILMEHTAPLVSILLESKGSVDLSNYNPYTVYEVKVFKPRGFSVKALKQFTNVDLLVYIDDIYGVRLENLFYVIKQGSREVKIPSYYTVKNYLPFFGTLIALQSKMNYKVVKIGEEALRNIVYTNVVERLREYGLV